RAREQAEGLLGALLRREIVGLAEIDRVDLLERDEVADVDRVGELDVQPVEVVRLDRHVAALLDLERADDVLRVDVLAGVLSHLVVADRHEVAPVDEVEAKLLRLGGGEHPDGDAHEPERDAAAPDRAGWHGRFVPAPGAMETARFRTRPRVKRKVTLLHPAGGSRRSRPVLPASSRVRAACERRDPQGISLWTLWIGGDRTYRNLLRKDAKRPKLGPSSPAELVAGRVGQLLDRLPQGLPQQARR